MIEGKNVYAIIPARGGSKGIPKKNIINFDGLPLIGHSILYAKKSNLIDKIFVSTDCDDIKNISNTFDVNIIKRPKNISQDNSSTELTIKHVIESQNRKNIIKFNKNLGIIHLIRINGDGREHLVL